MAGKSFNLSEGYRNASDTFGANQLILNGLKKSINLFDPEISLFWPQQESFFLFCLEKY
jgi:hypothetical protein